MMPTAGILKKKGRILSFLIICLIVVISLYLRLYDVRIPIGNEMHSFRQTQTAITVQNWFDDGYSFFHYQTPVLGEPWQIPFEAPVYQTAVYLVMRILGKTNIDLWGRLVSILFFYVSAFLLGKIVEWLLNRNAAYIVFFIYLFTPFNLYWSRAVLIDFTSVAFALAYVYCLLQWLKSERKIWYICALFCGIVGYLCKSTTMFTYVYFLSFVITAFFIRAITAEGESVSAGTLLEFGQKNAVKFIFLAALCVVPVIPCIAWTKYADYIKSLSPYTAWLTSKSLHAWNFGTVRQRLSLLFWKTVTDRILHCAGGGIPLLLAAVYFPSLKKATLSTFMLAVSFFSTFLTVFTLSNLYYVHDYYFIAVSPVICMFTGILVYEVRRCLFGDLHNLRTAVTVLFLILLAGRYLCAYDSRYISGIVRGDDRNTSHGCFIGEITERDERIFIEGEDWSPVTMYYANRKGMMFRTGFHEELFGDKSYTTYVFHNPTAVRFIPSGRTLVEYLKYANNGTFICKFFDANGPHREVSENFLHMKTADGKYLLSSGSDMIKIICKARDDNVACRASIECSMNNLASSLLETKIVFPAHRDTVYLNLKGISGVKSISFDTDIDLECFEGLEREKYE